MSSAGPEVDLLTQIETGQAPRRILEFAARGFVPLAPAELVRAIGSIIATKDAELLVLAEETFRGFDGKVLHDAVEMPGIRFEQLDAIARRTQDGKVLEPLIRHRNVANDTLAWLAERVPADLQDILITNQARLLEAPVIVEKLFENPDLSADIKRRADEFLEEFFLKKEREQGTLEEQEQAAEQVAAEAAAAKTAAEAAKVAPQAEGEEAEKQDLFNRISSLTIVQKIRLAFRGNKEERMLLIRDRNRLVSTAVLKSPKTQIADAESIAAMRSVSEDVLRGLSWRREWMRKYPVMAALVKNPRAPIDVTLPLVGRLIEKDLKVLQTDKNVPEAIRMAARRIIQQKQS